jgi:hypothetical protein
MPPPSLPQSAQQALIWFIPLDVIFYLIVVPALPPTQKGRVMK